MNYRHDRDGRALSSLFLVLIGLITLSPVHSQQLKPIYFEEVLAKRLAPTAGEGWTLEKFCPVAEDVVARRVLQSYGSMFVANDLVRVPSSCVQKGEADVLKFQRDVQRKSLDMAGVLIDLQAAATASLEIAATEAAGSGFSITPLDGAIAGGRSYGDTLRLWNSRFFPALDFWIKQGRLPEQARDEIGRLDLKKKIEKVLEWEDQGIWFSTGRTRSILTSTAPPGTSQHLSLLAFDVNEYGNPAVRSILNRNGWFQTVVDDPPHFTYLGHKEGDLPSKGLVAVFKGGHLYWVPNFAPRVTPTN